MSAILEFYRGESPDSEGRMISEIWQWGHDELELSHDYIQWLFPLDVESNFNPDAPLLSKEDQRAFRGNDLLQSYMRKSLDVWIDFLGLAFATVDKKVPACPIVKGSPFAAKRGLWTHQNHNWLRITRVLKSLRLCGLEAEASALFDCLRDLHDEGFVSRDSFEYWEQAMRPS